MGSRAATSFVTMVDNLIAGGQPDHARQILWRTRRLYPKLLTEVTWEILESWLPDKNRDNRGRYTKKEKVVATIEALSDAPTQSPKMTTCETCGEQVSILLYFTHQETHK